MSRNRAAARSAPSAPPPPSSSPDVEDVVVLDHPELGIAYRPAVLAARGWGLARLDELPPLRVDPAALERMRASLRRSLEQRRKKGPRR